MGVVRRNGCPKGCFWRVHFLSAPLGFSAVLREQTGSPKTPIFGQPFLRTMPSPLLWRALKILLTFNFSEDFCFFFSQRARHVFSNLVGGHKNTEIAGKREENPETLTKLVRKRLTRNKSIDVLGAPKASHPLNVGNGPPNMMTMREVPGKSPGNLCQKTCRSFKGQHD